MGRRKALSIYLSGTLGQIILVCIAVFILRSNRIKTDYTTITGMLAVGVGGISAALWGIVISIKYKKISLKEIIFAFIDVRKSYLCYALVFVFLVLNFAFVLVGGKFEVSSCYIPIILFLKAIIFGGIEEIGWRYTFQPILQEKMNYIYATIITFVSWGIWHIIYFYVEGSLYQVQMFSFFAGLLTNCFILSALYIKTKSLWICVMTHALINMFSQISSGGNLYVSIICKTAIIILAFMISKRQLEKGNNA